MTLPELLEPQPMYNQQYLNEAIVIARADADRLAATMAALLQSLDDDKAGRSMSMRICTTDSATRIARTALKAHEEGKG